MSMFNADMSLPPQSVARPGPVTRTLLQWMMRPARVVATEILSPRFRLINLEGENLKSVAWLPGQKVQVGIGSGLSSRSYTPMCLDADAGRMRLLAFLHGDGPGSRWAGSVSEGQACHFFGPRRSLDLSAADGLVVLFGDETSFGLAAALQGDGRVAELVFEVSDAAESRAVLTAIGLDEAIVVQRLDGDRHLAAIVAHLLHHVDRCGRFILTGKAQSIQKVSQALKKSGIGSSSVKSKAYWSLGKAGLD